MSANDDVTVRQGLRLVREDFEGAVRRPVAELGQNRGDGDPAVAGEADAVADVRGLQEFDVADLFSVRAPRGVAEHHEAEPTAVAVPALTAGELDHYQWLIGGLLDGAFVLATQQCSDLSSVPRAIDAAREIVDELMARLVPEGER